MQVGVGLTIAAGLFLLSGWNQAYAALAGTLIGVLPSYYLGNRIADGLAAAEKGQQDLANAEVRIEEALQEGRDKAQEFINQANKRGDEIVDQAKQTAIAEGERLLAAARSQIEQERNEARESLRGEVAALALAGAEQVLMREVDVNAHRDVLDKLTAEL